MNMRTWAAMDVMDKKQSFSKTFSKVLGKCGSSKLITTALITTAPTTSSRVRVSRRL